MFLMVFLKIFDNANPIAMIFLLRTLPIFVTNKHIRSFPIAHQRLLLARPTHLDFVV
jgi:hypothetical protein